MDLKEYLLKIRKNITKSKITEYSESISEKKSESNVEGTSLFVLNKILDKATMDFFPRSGRWYSSCFNQPYDLDIANLPCHLRDDVWLAGMLKIQQKLYYINFNQILKYVRTSDFFAVQRQNYERRIVAWQIQWMANGGENWIIDKEYGGDCLTISENCDLGFRKGIVDTLTAIGMDECAIEDGIEHNAKLWREKFMELAFEHRFEYTSYFPVWDDNGINLNPIKLEKACEEHKENWLKMRRYEYYQRHKQSVDTFGEVIPDMLMTEDEILILQEYLSNKNAERLNRIEEFKIKMKDRFLIPPISDDELYCDRLEQVGLKLERKITSSK